MKKPMARRLTLADLTILVAATAAALVMWRISRETLTFEAGSHSVFSTAYRVGVWPAPAILALSLALLVARAIRPRPRWRVVFRQPGTWAALTILAHLSVVVFLMLWRASFTPPPGMIPYRPNFNTYLYANRQAGSGVALAWATLALSRAWRPEPSWIDRTGRVLGFAAIVHWLGSDLVG
jgi:hypothetical protein